MAKFFDGILASYHKHWPKTYKIITLLQRSWGKCNNLDWYEL